MKLKVFYFQQIETVKHILTKLMENHKKRYNLNLINQGKTSPLNHLLTSALTVNE